VSILIFLAAFAIITTFIWCIVWSLEEIRKNRERDADLDAKEVIKRYFNSKQDTADKT
jgi:hypothetical protein